jgi:hypothetical protein
LLLRLELLRATATDDERGLKSTLETRTSLNSSKADDSKLLKSTTKLRFTARTEPAGLRLVRQT